jgi:hypothetical protein
VDRYQMYLQDRLGELEVENQNLRRQLRDLQNAYETINGSKDLQWLEEELDPILMHKPEGRRIELPFIERLVRYIKRIHKEKYIQKLKGEKQ